MFKFGDQVYVAEQDYHGEIVETRENEDGSTDHLVRYSVPFGRKPHYETWWPESHLARPQEQ